ncbi:MAG: hypothetical protein H0U49_12000 [Parachlamydiaceae bacterium]|nr:hypothetical protein [Parachlamydiaceae bacterium]
MMFSRSSSIPVLEVATVKSSLPESVFLQSKEAYDSIDEPVMHLKTGKISLQLPDLKNVLAFHGKNNRPDADPANNVLHIGFTGEKSPISLLPNESYYLLYDRKQTPPRYVLSPNNSETPLWMEVSSSGNQGLVKVRLKDETGTIIQEPASNAQFTLAEKPQNAAAPAVWDIGKVRVDGTLLARQKARWFGIDKFLERHGGPEFQLTIDKQRIDFGEAEEGYSVFISKDSILVWDNNHWKVAAPGAETLGKPILIIKKIDEKLMNFELWDAEGKNKVILNLLKSNESSIPPNLMASFHFLGAKTLSQFVFEINKERMTLAPQDWLLFVDKGWRKLTTPEEIDAYVDRKTLGYLFVFDAVEKRDDKQVMVGTIFNRARNDLQHVELLMQQSSAGMTPYVPKSDETGRSKDSPGSSDQGPQGKVGRGAENSYTSSYEDGDSDASESNMHSRRRKRKLDHDD